MEVHAHSHTPRKKWTHYFWEFLMLFLALTLGFFVENQREHYVEHNREIKYIHSLIEDLSADTINLLSYMSLRKEKGKKMDSLTILLTTGGYKNYGNETYYFCRQILNGGPFVSTDGTLQELKNGGNLRLIRKKSVVNKILAYDREVKALQSQDDADIKIRNTFREIGGDILNAGEFYKLIQIDSALHFIRPVSNPQLISDNPVILNKIAYQSQYMAIVTFVNFAVAGKLKLRAAELIHLLKEEYHIQ